MPQSNQLELKGDRGSCFMFGVFLLLLGLISFPVVCEEIARFESTGGESTQLDTCQLKTLYDNVGSRGIHARLCMVDYSSVFQSEDWAEAVLRVDQNGGAVLEIGPIKSSDIKDLYESRLLSLRRSGSRVYARAIGVAQSFSWSRHFYTMDSGPPPDKLLGDSWRFSLPREPRQVSLLECFDLTFQLSPYEDLKKKFSVGISSKDSSVINVKFTPHRVFKGSEIDLIDFDYDLNRHELRGFTCRRTSWRPGLYKFKVMSIDTNLKCEE